MEWDELAPLSHEQSASIDQLQSMITRLSPLVPGIDKSQITILQPPELSSLPSNHKLRDRFKEIQLKQQQLYLSSRETLEDDAAVAEDEMQYKFSQRPPRFNYVQYFVDQMTQQRHTPLQLTAKQQESWNYLTENANYMRTVLDSIENLQKGMDGLHDIYTMNQVQCQHIHSKCMHLIEEQQSLERQSNELRTMVKYFADYNQIRARIYSPKSMDVLSTEFHQIIVRINQCIEFLSNHKEYKESDQYHSNYQLLRGKCIQSIKQYVHQRLRKAEKDSKLATADAVATSTAPNQVSILEFRAAASRLRPLIELIEEEAKTSEQYAFLLNELQKMVLNERHNVLKQLVDSTINEYSNTRDTPNLIRSATSYVMMICLREHKLFKEFFDLDLTLKRTKSFESTTLSLRNRVSSSFGSLGGTSVSSGNATPRISMSSRVPSRIPEQRRAHSEEPQQSPSATPAGTKYTYLGKGGGGRGSGGVSSALNTKDKGDDFNVISGGKRIGLLIKDLCHLLYSYLRPFVIQTSSMQTLCDVIHILQGEIQEHIRMSTRSPRVSSSGHSTNDSTDDISTIAGGGRRRGKGGGGSGCGGDNALESNIPEFDRTVGRIIEDCQERLVFRTQIHLRDEVQHYEVNAEDLRYFEMLKELYAESNPDGDHDDDHNNNDGDKNGDEDDGGNNNNDEQKMDPDSEPKQESQSKTLSTKNKVVSRYHDWSPILERTLSVLSKVYPVLNHAVFEFLAYEAVSCCVSSLVELARRLASHSSTVHGHLFLIKHLLILREQISPFDVDFSITETTLDFGHMTQYLGDLVSSQKYSLVEVFQHSIPTVTKHQLNSKKSMESVLKKACEAFIETQTNLMIGPLIALISKYKQQTAAHRLKKRRKTRESLKKIHPLQGGQSPNKEQNEEKEKDGADDNDGGKEKENVNDHGMDEKERERLLNELNAILESFRKNLIVRIQELMETMKLYLQNALTQRILLKPIISNMQSAFIQLRKIVIETGLQHRVHLIICDGVSEQLQAIITKSSR